MKTSHMVYRMVALCLALAAFASSVRGANPPAATTATTVPAATTATTVPASTPYHVVDFGENYRIWQSESYELGPQGQVIPKTHKYTELASGLYYQKNGQWIESKELIESYPGGAIAQNGSYQVIFGNNLNSEGAIDLQAEDGKRLRSNILGLSYYDSATGNSVLIGQIQDSQGELISSNQVLYPNAFSGIKASVRYTYKRGSFEQDVVLLEQPPAPESLGLNSETTEIQVLTEFLNPPEARVIEHRDAENSLPDNEIRWGTAWIGQGNAFDLSDADSSQPVAHVRVRRQYSTIQGRHILVEAVPLSKIGSHLESLPLHASHKSKHSKMASKRPAIPKTPMARVQATPMKLASSTATANQGFVLDYIQINSSQTNMLFQGDTTYLISGGNSFSGTVTFEGGTILKFSPGNTIGLYSNIVCQTTPYRPAILTSANDNTIGDGISGSTGKPSSGGDYIHDYEYGTNSPISNMRFCYASLAFMDFSPCVTNCQFVNCSWAVAVNYVNPNPCAYLYNVLVTGGTCAGVWNVTPATVFGEHVTVNNGGFMNSTLYMTNCVLCNASGFGNAYGSHNGFYYTTDFGDNAIGYISYPFQTVGAGSYYLATNSPLHNAGTTNISPAVLADIAARTTYPPVVYSNTIIASATTLGPQAPRDNTGAPDLGYHYDPLDYLISGLDLTTNLTFTAGTALGWCEAYGHSDSTSQPGNGYFGSQPYGMAIDDGGLLNFSGTATQPCQVAVYNFVQEGNGNCTTYGWMAGFVLNGSGNLPLPQLSANFTKWSSTVAYNPLRDNWNYGLGAMANCELYVNNLGSYGSSFSFTNCLLWRSWHTFYSSLATSATYQNCTFFNGALGLYRDASQSASFWQVVNCAFDGTDLITQDGLNGAPSNTHFDYNTYNAGNTNWVNFDSEWGVAGIGTLETIGAHDQTTITNYNWETSWLGSFYLPPNSPLNNAGNVTADKVGLYEFTTQTNQLKEGFTYVDIGYHYVAVDPATGQPDSTYTNGIPDYVADSDGNGLPDWWEILYFGHTGVNALADPNGEGWNNYQDYVNGVNPTVGGQPAQVIVTMPGAGTIVP